MGLASALDPAENYATYAASDSVDFAGGYSRQIIVASGGIVQLVKPDGIVVPTPDLPDGAVLNVVAKRINSTDTGASGFFVLH